MGQIAIGMVIAGFIAVLILLLARAGPGRRVPAALRPGDTDDVLESDRLNKALGWFLALVVFFALFFPAYWLTDPNRRLDKEQEFLDESIERGAQYFALAKDPVTGEENHFAVECARCHGVDAEGGENEFTDPATGARRTVQVPELQTIFARYETPPPGFRDARSFIYETIERGRPGTDMPTWGNKFGGALTEQQLDDIVNWMQSIQKPLEVDAEASGADLFTQFCASCHGISGTGGSGPSMTGGSEVAQFPNIDDHIAFVKSGSVRGQPYGTSGTGTGAMPPWEGTLSDDQIRAVVEYERSL
ncbi:MAG TPA: c-type cytochrome [Actinomycetota bacterium]|nr:c-type cytochrome [Actinomycetota bacterium]